MTRRRIIWFGAALMGLMAVSCGKMQETGSDEWIFLEGDRPVTFSSRLSAPVTKTTSPLPSGTHFGVFAFYQPGTLSPSHPGEWTPLNRPNFMFNEEVYYNGSTYEYAPVKFWPNNPENTISFWAYSPHDAANLSFKVSGSESGYINSSSGIPDLWFVANPGNVDLLVSEMETNLSKQTLSETVDFTFHHVLSKVHVFIKTSAPSGTVQVRNVSLLNVYRHGVYQTDTGDFGDSGWTDSNQHHDYFYVNPSTDSPVSLTNSYQELGHLFLIPQTLSGSIAQLYVQYVDGNSTVPSYYNLSSATACWEPEKIYNYYISINPGAPIEFVAEIVPWGTDEGHVYITD